ncbi:tRNA lysidine(34) synthetase TilS [Novispirillum itersonii]|uniref:tRNA lysidine(34) synthetase TilS n=1 Tax=Novispirillum itersonii TaxID=189 RepID=UPI00037B86CB|nr:tRNA lysidine(34) synthetase TilS [Novispirillum itersonii]
MSEDLRVSDSEFAALMAGLGPFETAPGLAIAVSGGADSLALCLLAHRWAKDRGGSVVGLTVDHGLRPEAAAEARQVGQWLAGFGIRHHALTVTAPPPQSDLQNWARTQRYALLRNWCRSQGVLHLLLAHHRGDQAETLLLRLARGSGVSGLSGMSAVSYLPECRVLRPLLGIPKARLQATLQQQGQPWISDPSNESDRYQRVQMRQAAPQMASLGLTEARLAGTAHTLFGAREVVDALAATLVAETAAILPAGLACLHDWQRWLTKPQEVSCRALSGLLGCLGGHAYPPRAERIRQALTRWGQPMTLGGCRMVVERGALWIWREDRGIPVTMLHPGQRLWWDRRFDLDWTEATRGRSALPALTVRPLGAEGVRLLEGRQGMPALPRRALPVLLSLWFDRILVSVPHLGYFMKQRLADGPEVEFPLVRFRPVRAVSAAGMIRSSGLR